MGTILSGKSGCWAPGLPRYYVGCRRDVRPVENRNQIKREGGSGQKRRIAENLGLLVGGFLE
jgi:hypothetical protein